MDCLFNAQSCFKHTADVMAIVDALRRTALQTILRTTPIAGDVNVPKAKAVQHPKLSRSGFNALLSSKHQSGDRLQNRVSRLASCARFGVWRIFKCKIQTRIPN